MWGLGFKIDPTGLSIFGLGHMSVMQVVLKSLCVFGIGNRNRRRRRRVYIVMEGAIITIRQHACFWEETGIFRHLIIMA